MELKKLLPVSWVDYDRVDDLVYVYYDVIFTSNFGVFFKGELFEGINVDYENGVIEAFNEQEDVVKIQQFEFTPVFDENIKIPKTTMSCL